MRVDYFPIQLERHFNAVEWRQGAKIAFVRQPAHGGEADGPARGRLLARAGPQS
jgi:hypothetical protein